VYRQFRRIGSAFSGSPQRDALATRERMMRLSVVMPVFNEVETVEEAVRRVMMSPIEKELVIVDDGSTDGTAEKVAGLKDRWPGIMLIRHEENGGKGSALRAGFAAATGEIVIVQDADLEYDPADYPRLIAPIEQGLADVVYGSRFIGGDSHRVLYFWHSMANRVLTLFSNACTNLNLTDMTTCYKVFKRETLAQIKVEEDRFGFEPEATAKVARLKCRVYEVGISYHGRTYAEGKKIGWRDGFVMLWCIAKYNWRV
jgi:glycosyltransferase involved in cell wall biosynthesis